MKFISVYSPDSHKSFLIDSELKNFTENKFEEELHQYWTSEVKQNFVQYCDPFRGGKLIFLEKLKEYEFQTCQEIHLLQLKEQIKDITVVENFISKHGIEQFEDIYQEFIHNMTWEECKPVKVNVTIPAPGMNCTEYPQPYLDYEVKPVTLRADSMKCEVDKRTVCKPVKKQKCGRINYTQCLEVNTTHYSLHTTHYSLHTTLYTLHTENYTLHTEHYTHNTKHSTNSYTCVLPVRVSKSLTI